MQLLKRYAPTAFIGIFCAWVASAAISDMAKAPFTAYSAFFLCLLCFGIAVAYAELDRRYVALKRAKPVVPDSAVVDLALDYKARPMDKDNRYALIKLYARVNNKGDYQAEYERHGVNQSKSGVDCLRILTAADSNSDFEDLGIAAFDLKRQRAKLKIVKIEDAARLKIFDLYFKKPVQPNEQFEICYSLVWPRALRGSSDYDFIVLRDFQRGVEKLCYMLEFDKELSTYRFERLGKNAQWEYLDGKEEEQQSGSFLYTLEIQNPDCDAYRFFYTR